MYSNEYAEALRSYSPTRAKPFVDGLCGRILRGRPNQVPDEFETLTDNPASRLLVMLTDSEGLSRFFGTTDYQKCIMVGHTADHIQKHLNQGYVYKLIVFPAAIASMATWEEVFRIAGEIYPDICDSLVHKADMVRLSEQGGNSPLSIFERQLGYCFKDIDPSDTRFMSIDNFRKSDRGLLDLRAFFYHTLHFRELFRGDGYTYDETGNRGVHEYLIRNCPIASITGHFLIDLDVNIP